MLFFERIDTSVRIDVNQKSAIFFHIGIFQINGLSFNDVNVIEAMIQ